MADTTVTLTDEQTQEIAQEAAQIIMRKAKPVSSIDEIIMQRAKSVASFEEINELPDDGVTIPVIQSDGTAKTVNTSLLIGSFATVARTGSYNDLADKPSIPTDNKDLTNGSGYQTAGEVSTTVNTAVLAAIGKLHKVATSGSYADLSDTPTIPSKVSELSNDAGYVLTTDSRLSDARNAKDVYAWAKASTKPAYTASEVGAYSKSEIDTKLNAKADAFTVDTALSESSTNPVQNKVVNAALSGKSDTGHTHSVIVNGTTYTIPKTGGTAINLGTYLTSHQNIYALTVQGNGTTIGTYTPNSAAKTINITPASIGAAALSQVTTYGYVFKNLQTFAYAPTNGNVYVTLTADMGYVNIPVTVDICVEGSNTAGHLILRSDGFARGSWIAETTTYNEINITGLYLAGFSTKLTIVLKVKEQNAACNITIRSSFTFSISTSSTTSVSSFIEIGSGMVILRSKSLYKENTKYALVTDNVASATKLQNARTINGTSFDGSANITTAQWGTARNISIQDASGANTGTAVSVNGSADLTLKLPATIAASITGNASSATKLSTARTIWGQSFDGMGNVQGNMTGVGNITASGEIKTTSANALRLTYGSYGTIFRQDENYFYMLLTNKDDQNGSFNSLRPFAIGLADGTLTLGTPVVMGSTAAAYILSVTTAATVKQSVVTRGIELNTDATSYAAGDGGYIDFHFGGSTADYTSRIIELSSGVLSVTGGLSINDKLSVAGVAQFTGEITATTLKAATLYENGTALSSKYAPNSAATASKLGLVKVGSNLLIDSNGVLSVNDTINVSVTTSVNDVTINIDDLSDGEVADTIPAATTSKAGVMTAADKSKLDGLTAPTKETWTFTLENGSTVTKTVRLG